MTRRALLSLVLLLIAKVSMANNHMLALMPYPQAIEFAQGQHLLTKQLVLSISGMSEQRAGLVKDKLSAALAQQQHILLTEVDTATDDVLSHISLVVNQGNTLPFSPPKLGDDESYQLKVSERGVAIYAASDFGALHGVSTLLQLIWQASQTTKEPVKLALPLVIINDLPRFPWRGLMLDSVRHFISVEAIKRQLDGMAAAKLNVFHWHLTDDQGWRIESQRYPKLHQLASDGWYYRQQEIKDVVAYANGLGIRVVPEFDVPGHASAIAVAYPELISRAKSYYMEEKWGVFEPLLDPSNEQSYQFIDGIIAELSSLFPDEYIHIGGDEVNPQQWQDNEHIQQYMRDNAIKNEHELQVHFNQQVQQILAKHHKKMMGWDEIYHPNLPKNIMVQSWHGMESLAHITQAGYRGLLSTGFYIDQPQATSFHYRNEPFRKTNDQLATLQPSDELSAWQFTMPRIKGSAVNGTLAIISRNGYAIHGYVKLNNNHYQKVQIDRVLALKKSQINISLDTWMGPMRGEFDLVAGQPLMGRILIGNSHYPVRGAQLTGFKLSDIKMLAKPTQQNNILGGEATLWSELVTEDNLDLRIWPRTFAIAERFWSSQALTNVDNMYQRLMRINEFAGYIGLLALVQQKNGLSSLVLPNSDITPLLILAEQVEPASYYTRHHLKYRKGLYHQRAPLKQFVDFLPVESLSLVKMKQLLQAYQQGKQKALQEIIDIMRQWHVNFEPLVTLVQKNPKLSSIVPVVKDARTINTLGLTVAQSCLVGVKINNAEAKRIKNTLRTLHQQTREIALASGLFVEKLLETCRQ